MSNDRTVENVRLLYQSGSYKEALESCLAYLEDKEALTDESRKSEVKEVFLISALSLMNMSLVPPTSENRDIICTSIINACNYANSIEEAHQIENEVFSEFYLWKEKSIRAQLEKVENNPSFDNWKAYYPLIPEYSEFAIFLSLANFNNNVVNQYCESEGINKANYRDGYPLPQDQFTSDDRETLEYATGLRIYNRAKIELEESGNLSTVPAQALSRKVIEHLMNENEFYTPTPFCSLSKDDLNYDATGGYWLGGVWAPTNFALIRGLVENGRTDIAKKAAVDYLDAVCRVFHTPEYATIWECSCTFS